MICIHVGQLFYNSNQLAILHSLKIQRYSNDAAYSGSAPAKSQRGVLQ
jgi:hypothetical protein